MDTSGTDNPVLGDGSLDTAEAEGCGPRPRPKLILRLGLVCISCLILGIWLYNYVTLQVPLDRLSVRDSRNAVVRAKTHYDGWIDVNTVVFDIRDLSGEASRMDVFRVLLQFAETQKERRFHKVVLAARGQKKFVIPGEYFQQLGQEYETQNPVYTVRTFAPHLEAMDGSQPFPEYEGGILAVLAKEMEQFTQFHDQWYINDLVKAAK